MGQSTWTTASILASGAVVGAVVTYMAMKQPKANRNSDNSDARKNKYPSQISTRMSKWTRDFFFSSHPECWDEGDDYDDCIILTEADDRPNHQPNHPMHYTHIKNNGHRPRHTSHKHHRNYSPHRLREAIEKRERLPSLIILVRHGESEGNADNTLYRTKPDNLVKLTEKGIEQATKAGQTVEDIFVRYDEEQLKEQGNHHHHHHHHPKSRTTWKSSSDDSSSVSSLGRDDEDDDGVAKEDDTSVASPSTTTSSIQQASIKRVHLIISPFERTLQTAAAMRSGFEHRIVRTDVQPRIREQEFGNLQGDDFQLFRQEQTKVGRFWYRFPTGESGSDVSDRVQSWWHDSVLNVNERFGYAPIDSLVVVTHGLTMRFVLMQLYGWSPTTFHSVWNADNCDVYVLKKDLSKPGLAPYVLDETYGGNMPKSSIDVLVEFHNNENTSQEDAEITNEDGRSRPPRHQKQFKLSDYLSIPPPRTTQVELVKEKLVEQYPEEIHNVDSIKSIMFMPFFDGTVIQGRSTSGKFPTQEEDTEEPYLADKVAAIKMKEKVKVLKCIASPVKERRSKRHISKGGNRSTRKFPYFPEIQED